MELTLANNGDSLALPLPHEAAVIGVTESHGIGRKHAVFLCVKSQFIIMSSWVEQSKDWLGRVSSTPILLMLGSIIGVMWSGLKTLHTVPIMPKNHPPKSKNTNTLIHYVSLNSLFFLLDSNKNRLTSDLTFNQARDISEHIPGSIVKFQKMEANKCIQRINNKNNICSFDVPGLTVESKAPSMAEMMVNLPEFLGTAISYILQDFNYEHNKKSNTAIAIRILATMADRMEIVLRRMP